MSPIDALLPPPVVTDVILDGAPAVASEFREEDLGSDLEELVGGSERLRMTALVDRARLIAECLETLGGVAGDWVEAAAVAKESSPTSRLRSEEVLTGPAATARYLRQLHATLVSVAEQGHPRLPGRPAAGAGGGLRVPLFPARDLFDPITFFGFRGWARMRRGIDERSLPDHMARLYGRRSGQPSLGVSAVLGAGNISSVPVLDTFSRLFQHGRPVLLKLHPLHRNLRGVLDEFLAPLVDAGWLRVHCGGAELGAAIVNHELVDDIHITGGLETHDRIVWGPEGAERDQRRREDRPLLDKPITSELGNVSPWIVVPGRYSSRQLEYQAENLAASLVSNAGCNCVTTRVVITWRGWPQRSRFLDLVEDHLAASGPRRAFDPGARGRYAELTGRDPGTNRLRPTLLRDIEPDRSHTFFDHESFTCVSADVSLIAASEQEFLERAVDFTNERLWGTLSCTITLPAGCRRGASRRAIDRCLDRLRYGVVGINQWTGVGYATAALPWGGYPGSTLKDPHSGTGRVHNPLLLEDVEQAVFEGPLVTWPRPIWFPSHPDPEPAAWDLFELSRQPGWSRLGRLMRSSLGR